MPELPEVETVRRGLAAHLIGKQLALIEVHEPRMRVPVPKTLATALKGKTIKAINRRAKYLLIECSDNVTLLVHLGMSGSLILHQKPDAPRRKHDHILFTFRDDLQMRYHDPRRFGVVTMLATNKALAHPLLKHLGPEPLDADWKATHLHAALKSRRGPVKTAIMDQLLVVGVGNIYACEALFLSHIHPERKADSLSQKETTALHSAIRKVLSAAIASGGSTLRDYVRSSGDAGYFQHAFQVYGRKNLPCFTCNKPVAQIKQSGRSSFFCKQCQR